MERQSQPKCNAFEIGATDTAKDVIKGEFGEAENCDTA